MSGKLDINRGSIVEQLLTLVFPERCLFCRTLLPYSEKGFLCPECGKGYTVTGSICPHCEQQKHGHTACRCLPEGYPLKALFALSFYEENWRTLLHDLKYHNRRSAARPLGRWLGREIKAGRFCSPDLVVPVPLHRRRLQERGFNQSELIARYIAKELERPQLNLLERVKETRSQTTISRRQRRENMHRAFRLRIPPEQDQKILLVDDIFSTGSTLTEAASILTGRGAIVYGTVVAYNRRFSL